MATLRFNDVEFDRARRRVVVAGEPFHVEPQVFDVLDHLVEHRDRVVTKEELLDEIWGSRFVSESALTSRIKSARAAVGDSGRAQHTIRTVHGTGYQFVAEVTESESEPAVGDDAGVCDRSVGSARFTAPPRPEDGFHGRDGEVAEVLRFLEDGRLVTLVGPGGTGKTRLALEVVERRDDPGAFLDLTTVRDGAGIAPALVSALGIQPGSGHDEVTAAATYLRGADLTLLVDNCEHVSTDAAEMLRALLERAPTATVLATSRVPLGLRDEHVVRIDPLPVPDDPELDPDAAGENPAVALFVERTSRTARPVVLDRDSVADVVALCARLDGLPLALELAAGCAGSFDVRDLLVRLDRRLDLLDDDRADTHERHRSLRATLDWSFEDLDEPTQRLFVHLAVFPAGLTLDGIEWLAGRLALDDDPLRSIDRLVSASLVNRVERPSGSRYVQLETMRAFGEDCLETHGILDTARDLQAEWTLRLLRDQRELTRGRRQREHEWNDRIRREIPNIRHCRQHLWAAGRHADLVQVSADLDEWAELRDVSEFWTWIDELMAVDSLDDELRLRVVAMASLAAWRRGRVAETERFASEVIEGGSDDWAMSRALSSHGVAMLFTGNFVVAAQSWLRAYELSGSPRDGANGALSLGYAGDFDEARRIAAEAYRRAVESGWASTIAWTAYACGEIEATAGDLGAVAWLEMAVERAEEVGASFTFGVASVTRCSLMVADGRVEDAAAGYRDLISHWLRSGTWTQLWTTIRNAVDLLVDDEPALWLLAVDAADADPLASDLDDTARAQQDLVRSRIVDELGSEAAAAVTAERRHVDRVDVATRVRSALERRVGGRPVTPVGGP